MGQQVVVYWSQGRCNAYSTAYDSDEATRQLARCRQRHGIHCNAMAVSSEKAWGFMLRQKS